MALYHLCQDAVTTGYGITITGDEGKEVQFGPYETKEELFAAVKPYCEVQVKAGNMSQKEADEILR